MFSKQAYKYAHDKPFSASWWAAPVQARTDVLIAAIVSFATLSFFSAILLAALF